MALAHNLRWNILWVYKLIQRKTSKTLFYTHVLMLVNHRYWYFIYITNFWKKLICVPKKKLLNRPVAVGIFHLEGGIIVYIQASGTCWLQKSQIRIDRYEDLVYKSQFRFIFNLKDQTFNDMTFKLERVKWSTSKCASYCICIWAVW